MINLLSGRTAEDIKNQLARFRRDELKLELSHEKTLVTHARTRAARYLGYGACGSGYAGRPPYLERCQLVAVMRSFSLAWTTAAPA
jgi:hypothetical protein